MATFKVSGIKEIKEAFDELGKKAGGQVVRKAVRGGVKIFKAEIVRTIPEDTGKLKKAVKVRAVAKKRRGVIAFEVRIGDGDFKGETFYGAFQEFGTKRMKGQRFMTRAFASKQAEAIKWIVAEIYHGIFRGRKK